MSGEGEKEKKRKKYWGPRTLKPAKKQKPGFPQSKIAPTTTTTTTTAPTSPIAPSTTAPPTTITQTGKFEEYHVWGITYLLNSYYWDFFDIVTVCFVDNSVTAPSTAPPTTTQTGKFEELYGSSFSNYECIINQWAIWFLCWNYSIRLKVILFLEQYIIFENCFFCHTFGITTLLFEEYIG